ncbi:unnamed protein product [Adineta ricciae]|uniref:Uncharacterized protein n=1 Tax=Adineta ricciae TaxID=249248 RepID=A0A815UBU4_ADIRI|nr:unnamed protein product [Adineta ricciae]CAF1516780.1 unnamed protein product [Adineta ricciae]
MMKKKIPLKKNFRRLLHSFKSYLLELNLFNTGTHNEINIRNERRSTRLYLVLLIISILIAIQYYSIIYYPKTIVLQSPSLSEYLTVKEEASLQCPCTNIAIKYENFTRIIPFYYELCESEFVSDKWINHLFRLYEQSWNKSDQIDFRRIGVFQFQTLHSLCQLTKKTIDNNLRSFKYTDFVQFQLVSPDIFQAQISSVINEFIHKISKSFIRTLSFMQDVTAQSLFMTGASITSVQPILRLFNGHKLEGYLPYPGINYTFMDGTSCICSSSTATNCMGLAIFDGIVVSGFQTGCYMLNALMNSTLEAFYNQTFIDMLTNSSINLKTLNTSNSNWTIKRLLDKMFVQSWLNQTSYDKYFQSCAPELCSYIKMQHYSVLDILILMISLFQGLPKTLRVFVPIFINRIWPIIRKKICQKRSSTLHIAAVRITPGNLYTINYSVVSQILILLFDLNPTLIWMKNSTS